jgi:hypothetical protein
LLKVTPPVGVTTGWHVGVIRGAGLPLQREVRRLLTEIIPAAMSRRGDPPSPRGVAAAAQILR